MIHIYEAYEIVIKIITKKKTHKKQNHIRNECNEFETIDQCLYSKQIYPVALQ